MQAVSLIFCVVKMHLILAFDVQSSIEAHILQGYKAYNKVQLALFEIYEVFA
jgi:hypothetical protein